MVEGLKVRRTLDNKTVHAFWEELKTTLPVGVVSRYKIEYRDNQKNSVSTVFQLAKYNFLVVTNVINANTYEVRNEGIKITFITKMVPSVNSSLR